MDLSPPAEMWHKNGNSYSKLHSQSPCICWTSNWTDLLHKSHNATVPYPTMLHFVTKMCTCVHCSVTKWCVMGHLFDALWDLWNRSTYITYSNFLVTVTKVVHYSDVIMCVIASQITGVSIVYSTVCSCANQRKYQSSVSLGLWGEFTGDRWIPHTRGQ